MKKFQTKGARISRSKGIREAIITFLKDTMKKGCFDAILIPMRVPAGDSYAWILVKDNNLLDDANPIAPIMPVQGASALSCFSRKGEISMRIAALMRPCEIRAAIELSKLNQAKLTNITLISYDCSGALPMSDYLQDPEAVEKKFSAILKKLDWDEESVKPVCRICDEFSLLPVCDLHFGIDGDDKDNIFLIPNSKEGKRILKEMNMEISEDISGWDQKIKELIKKKEIKRKDRFKEVQKMVEGLDHLAKTFSDCIGCHNCQSVCPICYCRHCYFDSEVSKPDSEAILLKAKRRGGISFPMDKIMFHVGRMSHMSLSCVSCGLCSDACPVSIPVAELFSCVANSTQKTFEYKSGEERGEPIPMKTYKLEESKGIHELVKEAEG